MVTSGASFESDAFLSATCCWSTVANKWQSPRHNQPAAIAWKPALAWVEWVCYPQPGEQQELRLFHVRRIETGVFVGTCHDTKTKKLLSRKVIIKALFNFWELGASSFVLSSSLPLTLKPAPCMSGDGDIVTGLPGHMKFIWINVSSIESKDFNIKELTELTSASHTKNVEVQRLLDGHDATFQGILGEMVSTISHWEPVIIHLASPNTTLKCWPTRLRLATTASLLGCPARLISASILASSSLGWCSAS